MRQSNSAVTFPCLMYNMNGQSPKCFPAQLLLQGLEGRRKQDECSALTMFCQKSESALRCLMYHPQEVCVCVCARMTNLDVGEAIQNVLSAKRHTSYAGCWWRCHVLPILHKEIMVCGELTYESGWLLVVLCKSLVLYRHSVCRLSRVNHFNSLYFNNLLWCQSPH